MRGERGVEACGCARDPEAVGADEPGAVAPDERQQLLLPLRALLAQLGETAQTSKAVADGIAYLRRTQLAEGSWYGRWGLNFIYGTWSVLCALNAAGVDHQDPMIRKAAAWLASNTSPVRA